MIISSFFLLASIKNDTGEYPEMIIYKHGVNLEDALAIEKELILKIGSKHTDISKKKNVRCFKR